MDKKELTGIIRDSLATLKWQIWEHAYWKKYIDDLMAEAEFYDYEIELHTKYREKDVTSPQEAFAFMDNLIPSKENAFLFRR